MLAMDTRPTQNVDFRARTRAKKRYSQVGDEWVKGKEVEGAWVPDAASKKFTTRGVCKIKGANGRHPAPTAPSTRSTQHLAPSTQQPASHQPASHRQPRAASHQPPATSHHQPQQ